MKYEIISNVMLHGVLRKKGETIELDPESADALDMLGRNLIEPFREEEVKPKVEEVKEESFENKDKKEEIKEDKDSPKKRGRPKKGK